MTSCELRRLRLQGVGKNKSISRKIYSIALTENLPQGPIAASSDTIRHVATLAQACYKTSKMD